MLSILKQFHCVSTQFIRVAVVYIYQIRILINEVVVTLLFILEWRLEQFSVEFYNGQDERTEEETFS